MSSIVKTETLIIQTMATLDVKIFFDKITNLLDRKIRDTLPRGLYWNENSMFESVPCFTYHLDFNGQIMTGLFGAIISMISKGEEKTKLMTTKEKRKVHLIPEFIYNDGFIFWLICIHFATLKQRKHLLIKHQIRK